MGDEADRMAAQLAELGLDGQLEAPEVLHLTRGASTQDYALVQGTNVRASTLPAGTSDRPLFVRTAHVSAKTAEVFRRAGVQYLDTAGNAWIEFGDVLVDVRGRPRPADAGPRFRAAGNLFSSSRAQVVLVLLTWPELWDASRRALADAAGVSLGQAHNTIALLDQAGYDQHRAGLLDLWAAAFPTGLAQRLMLATYRGEVAPVKRAGTVVTVSGEAAVPELLRAATLTLYVDELNPRLAIANRWRTDGQPNIVVRRRFWHEPAALDVASPDLERAPWPLVYADLLSSTDPRVRAAAKQYRESRERPH